MGAGGEDAVRGGGGELAGDVDGGGGWRWLGTVVCVWTRWGRWIGVDVSE